MEDLGESSADIFEYYGATSSHCVGDQLNTSNLSENCYNWTALHEACYNNQIDRCKDLIDSGEILSLLVEDHEHRTPIFLAVSNRNKEICKILIDAGADISARNKEGSTVLHVAVKEDDYHLCEMLIFCGANVNATNRIGQSPIFLVEFASQRNILSLLLSHGADLELQDHLCTTPLGKFGFPALLDIICSCSSEESRPLAHVCGGTLLHIAVKNRYRENVEALLCSYADVNARDKVGATPLHCAVSAFWSEGCSLLLSRGADVNASDFDGNNALHKVRDPFICQLLLQVSSFLYLYVCGKNVVELRSCLLLLAMWR